MGFFVIINGKAQPCFDDLFSILIWVQLIYIALVSFYNQIILTLESFLIRPTTFYLPLRVLAKAWGKQDSWATIASGVRHHRIPVLDEHVPNNVQVFRGREISADEPGEAEVEGVDGFGAIRGRDLLDQRCVA